MSPETQNFKIGPCSITYKGELLGITNNSSSLSFNFGYYDVTCNKTHDQVLEKRLTGIEIIFRTEILQVDNGVNHLLNENKTWTLDELGQRESLRGGELLIVPISQHDKSAYRLPNALVVNQGELIFNNDEEYILKLEFEANYHDGEEILIEYLDADTCQRESLQRNSISSISLERAMTAYIADKLSMTVDTDIFRGGIPENVDGCGVEIVGYEKPSIATSDHYIIRFSCINDSRNNTMQTINDLVSNFPVYGENITIDNGETVNCKVIMNVTSEFFRKITDNGKVKTFGELLLEVII